jgi:hypothetical protein
MGAPPGNPRSGPDTTARTVVARARTTSSDGFGGSAARSLPLAIQALVGGGAATILLIVLAIALRAPLPDIEKRAIAAASAPITGASAAPAVSSAPSAARSDPASAAPPASPPTQSEAGREAAARFSQLIHQGTQFEESVNVLGELLTVDPSAAARSDVRAMIIKLAQRIMLVKSSKAPDRFFALVTDRMGPTGIDILFELETTRGSSLGAARASELLRDATIRSRGTAALQIAYEIRHTRNCEELLKLLDRAQADGDGRALGQLLLLGRLCGRRDSDCCLNDQRFKDTLSFLRKRGR